jgi:type IV pilus assembly protein PilM
MDIGTDASNLIITDGAKIIWQRPIPLGGNNFTRALTKELKLTFAKAEHLKRNAAKSPEMANILKAIKPVLTDFVGEVQRSLGYFTNTHRDAHVAYLVGLGSAFKLPGLQKYLGDKLSLDVRKPTKFARLGGEGVLADPLFQENVLTFPIAYGLALQGLGQARISTNLLPTEIRMDRLIRAKKPYAAAAAAALLIGTTGLALGYASPYASINDSRIKDGIVET